MVNIKIPDEVQYIIDTLDANGYEAYVVGGCVRDAVLGEEPKDWDICTPALPEQTIKCFEGQHIIETGLKHGTVMYSSLAMQKRKRQYYPIYCHFRNRKFPYRREKE